VFPPVNILKRSDGCVVRAEVPGLAAEDLSIESQGQSLTITGKRGPGLTGNNAPKRALERRIQPFSGAA
jgi:HSP20 family molecular chaperone IbpA